MSQSKRTPFFALITLFLAAALAQAQTRVNPGWNLFSKDQDIQMGKEYSQEIEKEVQVVNDRELTKYISTIGQRLAKNSQDTDFPYTFKLVNDPSINAFALPGGPIYVHTGLITAAANEAQLAGVLAHEVSHVALRHSTNRASKANAFQIPLMIASGALSGKGGILPVLANLGLGFGVNSIMLKYSRGAEKDADLVGAQTMARAGYNPVEMARFFETLEAAGGGGGSQFFSDHPNPGNRVEYVSEEIKSFPQRGYDTNTAEFNRMKARAQKIQPAAKQPAASAPTNSNNAGQPASGSAKGTPQPATTSSSAFRAYQARTYRIDYPSNWTAHPAEQGTSVTLTPPDGVVKGSGGQSALARGVLVGYFSSEERSLSRATDALVADLRKSNPLNEVRGQRQAVKVSGYQGESILLEGNSPIGNQREYVWAVTVLRPQGLFYTIFVTPENEYQNNRNTFDKMLQSIQAQ